MEWVKLGDIAEITAGKAAPKEDEFSENGLPFIRAGHLEELIKNGDATDFPRVSPEVAKSRNYKIFNPGTILFAKSGMSIMKDRVVTLREPAYIVSHLAAITIDKEKVNRDYLKYQIMFRKPSNLIQGDSYPSISISDISDWELYIPNLKKQSIVASSLVKCDKLIAKRREQIDALDALVSSVFYEMFLSNLEDKERTVNLSDITSHISSGSTPRGGKEVYTNDGIPFIRSQDVLMNHLDLSEVAYIPIEIHKAMKRSTLHYKDVLINITGASIGRTAVFYGETGSANTNQHVASIRLKGNVITPEFLSYYFSTEYFQKVIQKVSSGGTREALNYQQIGEFRIPEAPISKQEMFVRIKNSIETQKESLRASLSELEILFDALMQEAFSGHLNQS